MSQVDAQTKTIGPDTYSVHMLDPLVASDLFLDLVELFGPALGAVGSSILKAENSKEALKQLMDGTGDSGDLIGENLERALTGMIDRISKAKQREIIDLMTEVTSVKKAGENGEENWPKLRSIFPIHFRGRPKAMYQWLLFSVRVQFADFT